MRLDIYHYQEDSEEDPDSAYGDGYSDINSDASLPPVAKMEKYASSEIFLKRQIVARTVLDTLRQVSADRSEVDQVFSIVSRLSQDGEPSVRAELMEQVPHIAMYCQEMPENLAHVVPDHLLPLVVKFLTDLNSQVRKTSQAALLVLLEQGLVDKSDVEEQVCPVIIKFTDQESMDEHRTEAAALLSQMAPLIGKEMSERLFLHRFAALCLDPLFHVRKVCAAKFGDFSGVVGPDSTQEVLLPKFFQLCEDSVWGIRKACADVFMPVSCVCSPAVRQTELSPLFLKLLQDQSRWVRTAAFQALGPFISTFADPAITALLHNENGEMVITDAKQLAERLDQLEKTRETARLGFDSSLEEEDASSSTSESTPTPVTTTTTTSQSDSNATPQNQYRGSSGFQETHHREQQDELQSSAETDTDPNLQNTINNNSGKSSRLASCPVNEHTNNNVATEDGSKAAGIVDTSVLPMEEGEDEEWSAQLVLDASSTASPEERRAEVVMVVDDGQIQDNLADESQNNIINNNASVDDNITVANNNIDHALVSSISPTNQSSAEHTGSTESDGSFTSSSTEQTCSLVQNRMEDSSSTSNSSTCAGGISRAVVGGPPGPDTTNFSSFLYWREPVPDVELVDIDLGPQGGNSAAQQSQLSDEDAEMMEIDPQPSTASSAVVDDDDELMPELVSIKNNLSNLDTDSSTEGEMGSGQPETKLVQDASSGGSMEGSDSVASTSAQSSSSDRNQSEDTDSATWSNLPVITFEKFDNITGGDQANSTMELYRPGGAHHNISTFDPKSSWDYKLSNKQTSSGSSTPSPSPVIVDYQSVVPQLLIDNFVLMIDPTQAQMVDNDIARHCAYSLPAVALTLGRSNWPLLRKTYGTLAMDMQWKVRRTVASSIHELGVILGAEVTARDLVPIFNGFIKDLDEVRIGVLKHLSDFLKLLDEKERVCYLPKLEEFLKMDNDKNWRFRLELAEQLGLLIPLFSKDDIRSYLAPIASNLVQDKVAAVRLTATEVISSIIQTLDKEQSAQLVAELADKLAHSSHWARRQTFVMLCCEVVRTSFSSFCQDLLPHLIDLTWDRVPNVRLHVARVLGEVIPQEYFDDPECEHREKLLESLKHLASDRDTDVRDAATKCRRVEPNPPSPPPITTQPPEEVAEDDLVAENKASTWAEVAAMDNKS